MSTRRRIRHAPPVRRYSTRDIVLAVAVGLAAVVGTALAIWMLRPGGIADRQPRATWLVALALATAGLVLWWVVRPRSKRRGRPVPWIVSGVLLVALAAVVIGIVWPGGLLRHYVSPEPVTELPELPSQTTTPASSTPSTTAPGATTPDSTAPPATTTPAATTP